MGATDMDFGVVTHRRLCRMARCSWMSKCQSLFGIKSKDVFFRCSRRSLPDCPGIYPVPILSISSVRLTAVQSHHPPSTSNWIVLAARNLQFSHMTLVCVIIYRTPAAASSADTKIRFSSQKSNAHKPDEAVSLVAVVEALAA